MSGISLLTREDLNISTVPSSNLAPKPQQNIVGAYSNTLFAISLNKAVIFSDPLYWFHNNHVHIYLLLIIMLFDAIIIDSCY